MKTLIQAAIALLVVLLMGCASAQSVTGRIKVTSTSKHGCLEVDTSITADLPL